MLEDTENETTMRRDDTKYKDFEKVLKSDEEGKSGKEKRKDQESIDMIQGGNRNAQEGEKTITMQRNLRLMSVR